MTEVALAPIALAPDARTSQLGTHVCYAGGGAVAPSANVSRIIPMGEGLIHGGAGMPHFLGAGLDLQFGALEGVQAARQIAHLLRSRPAALGSDTQFGDGAAHYFDGPFELFDAGQAVLQLRFQPAPPR